MDNIQEVQYKQVRALLQTLSDHLITLATSLKGRLTPGEEDILANLFQVQIDLQTLLYEISLDSEKAATTSAVASDSREIDTIAYAQAMQYARDLVKTLRQKKEHQRRLELTSQQLIRAEKLATVGQIAAAVAHELGNIFTPLLMYSKLVYEETADLKDSEAAEFALQITKITHRASHMLRQLVDASRTESTMIIMPVSLPQAITNTLNLLSPQINKLHIRVIQYYPDNVPLVMGHPDQLEQVFINIIRNAFDAMPDGGDLKITIETNSNASESHREADFIAVRFSDSGMGITPEHIGSLFEPFFTTKARGAGTGLGLFVSYLIINQHGGTIEVDSQPGAGATFIVKLPSGDREGGVE
jgi:two-component system NtrC family sensor kinase